MVSLARRGSPYEEEGLDPRLALSVPEQLYRLLEELGAIQRLWSFFSILQHLRGVWIGDL